MARSTKRDIVLAMVQFLRQKRLDEITVKDLTQQCGISRQAFYYHFSDLYDVVKLGIQWELERLSSLVAAEHDNSEEKGDWERVLELVEDRMMPNRTVVLNVYRSLERSYVQHHLMTFARPFMAEEIKLQARGYRVTEDQKQFVAELVTMGLVDIFLGWLDMGMPSRSLEHLDDFRAIVDGGGGYILKCLEEKNQQ